MNEQQTIFARLVDRIDHDTSTQSSMCDREQSAIAAAIPGWSRIAHWVFFRALLDATPLKRLLVLGVYQGRDISYVLALRNRWHPGRELDIIGVDRFTDQACSDWTDWMKGQTWAHNGFGPPPSIEQAAAHIGNHMVRNEVRLAQDDTDHFLDNCTDTFDTIYVDAGHDGPTVTKQLEQIRKLCAGPDTVICGDDYIDAGTWGVASAVKASFSQFNVVGGQIWLASAANYLKK